MQTRMTCLEATHCIFFFFFNPSFTSGVHHAGWDVCVCDFFNPTIEVVTFRLRGWRMLDVFVVLAFTRLGHECQGLLSLCDGIHVYMD